MPESSSPVQPNSGTHKSRLPAIFFFVAVVTCLIAGLIYVGYNLTKRASEVATQAVDSTIASITGAFRPEINVNTTVMSALGELHKSSKLVVMTASIDVSIVRESRKTILWDLLDLGTTTVSIDLPDNKVQFYIPMDGLSRDSFNYDGSKLSVTVPAPVPDEEIVEVQSDPRRIRVRTDVGWGRLRSRSGEQLRQEALTEIRSHVLAQAKAEPLRLAAESAAATELRSILGGLTAALREGVTLEIRFVPPAGRETDR